MQIKIYKEIDKIWTSIYLENLADAFSEIDKGDIYVNVDGKMIKVTEKEIYSVYNDGKRRCSNILIHFGLSVELGMDIRIYNEILARTRIPIFFNEIIGGTGDKRIYRAMRIGTGKIKPVLLATILTDNYTIKTIQFSDEVYKNEEFMKYFKPNILNQFSLDTSKKAARDFEELLKIVFSSRAVVLGFVVGISEIKARVKIDGTIMLFTFAKRESGEYKLVSIRQ